MLFRYPFVAMGSGCEILVEHEQPREVKPLLQSALGAIQRLETKYSYFREDSLLSRVNRDGHGPGVELDDETAFLLEHADAIHKRTHGAFDPTVGGVRGCWDFGAMTLPDPQRLQRALEGVGWHHVSWREGRIRLGHPATRLDFGGLVKEYAIDAAVSVLQTLGARRGMVNLGGDLRIVGSIGEGERPYRVGVAHPRRHHGTCTTLLLRSGAVVTSGDYQRYFLRDGVRYHHLLDPMTGRPFALAYSGVTAHGVTAMDALKACKGVILASPGRDPVEPEGAFLACGPEGDPVGWRESNACRFSLQTPPRRTIGAADVARTSFSHGI